MILSHPGWPVHYFKYSGPWHM